MEFNKITTTGQLGITDLKSNYPYYGEYSNWNPAFADVTEESYKSDVKGYEERVKEWNENYVDELKEKGEYGKEYHTHFHFMPLHEFDSEPVNNNHYDEFCLFIPNGNSKKSDMPKLSLRSDYDKEK